MNHNIEAFLVPSTATATAIQVGNSVTVEDVEIASYSIADQITIYADNGIGKTFRCCEIKPETTAREQYSRNVFGVHDMLYINADRDLDFKEDDIVLLPLIFHNIPYYIKNYQQ